MSAKTVGRTGFSIFSVVGALTPLAVHVQDSVYIKMFAPENGARV